MKKFADFAKPNNAMTGDKIKIDKVLDKEIVVKSYKIGESKYKEDKDLLTLQIELSNEERVIFTSSSVLINQIKEYESEMPFIATIKQINNYYTFA